MADEAIAESLGRICAASTDAGDDSDRTASYSVGTASSDGQRFRVLRPHARGGLGAVFVALDAELHREVALKQMLDHLADEPASRQRFLVEAEITGGLEHPGIVPVYGLGTYADGRPFYAMRFIRGDSLKEAIAAFHQRMNYQPPSPRAGEGQGGGRDSRDLQLRRLLGRFVDVCNAVGYAHSRGVIHRDIKPANVIVGKHGETLVVDWGLAKSMGRADPGSGERTLVPASASGSAETLPGSALGTPAYMSPEQAAGDLDRLGPRTDVYSLGATLYCLLAGQPPYTGDDAGSILRAVQRGEFRPPRAIDPAIDAALEAVCLKAMALEPEDRYGSPRALVEEVERWMADEPVAAWREPLGQRARRWARRNRTPVTAAGVALVAGTLGLAGMLAVQTQSKADIARALANETRANIALAAANTKVQARYELAMEAVKTFHTGVSEDFLLKQEQFKEQRDRLLNSAADFYGKLGSLLGPETDQASRRALLQANFEAAALTAKVGRKEDALTAHRAVLVARESLAAEPGADAQARVDVGRSMMAVAMLLAATGQTADALAEYRRSESLLAGLAGTEPGARAALAACRSAMASLLSRTGEGAQALAAYRLARSEQEALAAAPGASTDARREPCRHNPLDWLAAVENGQARGGGGRIPRSAGAPAEAGRRQSCRRRLPQPPGAQPPPPRHLAVGDRPACGGGGRIPPCPGDPAEAGRRQSRRHRVPQQPGEQPHHPRRLVCGDGQVSRRRARVPQGAVDPAEAGRRQSCRHRRPQPLGGHPHETRRPAVGYGPARGRGG